jgi:hypothetical protein
VTFVDELEDERSAREKERNSRKISGSNRSSHGLGHGVASDSSDDEDTARDRERKAEEKRKERRRTEAKAAIEVRSLWFVILHIVADRTHSSATSSMALARLMTTTTKTMSSNR